MKIIKLVVCALVGLFTLTSLLRLMLSITVALRIMNSSSSDDSSYAFGQVMGGVFALVIGTAITLKLWKSAMKPNALPEKYGTSVQPPIPDPKGINHE